MAQIQRSVKLVAVFLIAPLLAALVLTACANQPDQNTVAKYLPSDTLAFVTAALSPSVKQKVSLVELSQHLPASAHIAKAADTRDTLLQELFKGDNLNYSTDIKPWLGTEAALAVLPPVDSSNTPIVVVAVKVTNSGKAYNTLQAHNVDPSTFRFNHGYLFLVDESQLTSHAANKALDAVDGVISGKTASLASRASYKADLATLHGQHIVLGWADLPALAKLGVTAYKAQTAATDEQDASAGLDESVTSYESFANADQSAKDINGLQKQADAIGAVSFELYAESSDVKFEAVTEKATSTVADGSDHSLLNSLPATLNDALDVSNFSRIFSGLISLVDSNDATTPAYQNLSQYLGDEAVVTYGGANNSDIGVVDTVTSAGNASNALAAVAAQAQSGGFYTVTKFAVSGGTGWAYAQVDPFADYESDDVGDDTGGDEAFDDDGNPVDAPAAPAAPADPSYFVAVANGRIAAGTSQALVTSLLAGNGTLGTSAPLTTALGNSSQKTNAEVFVNVAALVAAAKAKDPSALSGKSSQWLNSLGVVGVKNWNDGQHDYLEVNVTFGH